MQLAFCGDGLRDITHSFVGTAGIAVRHKGNGQTGFLTNQHVADAPGREQEKWTYAIDLGKVLDRLDLEILA